MLKQFETTLVSLNRFAMPENGQFVFLSDRFVTYRASRQGQLDHSENKIYGDWLYRFVTLETWPIKLFSQIGLDLLDV